MQLQEDIKQLSTKISGQKIQPVQGYELMTFQLDSHCPGFLKFSGR